MKRFNCTLSDKRGEFGECMEAHSTGRYVLFSDVEKLQRRIQDLLDKSNRTGVAIESAISTGSVLDDHPLKSRLELLANHHKREQELAAQLSDATSQCGVMAELLRDGCDINKALGFIIDSSDNDGKAEALSIISEHLDKCEAALAGKLTDPAVSVTETIRTAPERIWLQVGDQPHYHSEPFPSDTSEVSWCADSVVGCEVPYVRADLAAPAVLQGGEPCDSASPSSSPD